MALDGKPPLKDELVVSISTPTTGQKKVGLCDKMLSNVLSRFHVMCALGSVPYS